MGVNLKISSVESLLPDEHCHLLRIETRDGTVGVGGSGYWGYPEAVEGIFKRLNKYLIGQDPLRISYQWNFVYREGLGTIHRGGALNAALSAIDIALWDIAGKHYGAPVYQLLGGKHSDKLRAYTHIKGNSDEEVADNAIRAVKTGFTAVRFGPFGTGYPDKSLSHSEMIKAGVDRVRSVREAVGDKIDICVDVRFGLSPSEAIVLAKEIEKYNLLFLEDPTAPDSPEAMAYVKAYTSIPIATGERLHTIYEFKDLLQQRACDIVRPDICLAGGITQCKKIAGMAEAFQVGVAAHNPLGPVSTAACVQLDACIPNFIIQEYTGEGEVFGRDWMKKTVKEPLKIEKGHLLVPDKPGIGVELDEEVVRERCKMYRMRTLDRGVGWFGSARATQ